MSHKHRNKKNRHSSSSSSQSINSFPETGFCQDEKNYEIRKSELMGRYLVALKQFQPGEIILSEEPLVVGPCTNTKIQCLACYKSLENTSIIIKCEKCGWPLCSPTCQGLTTPLGHTPTECLTLQSYTSPINFTDPDTTSTFFNIITPLRCLLLKETSPESYSKLMQMESHTPLRQQIPSLWHTNDTYIVKRLRCDFNLARFTPEEIHRVCGVLEVNAFELGHHDATVRGLFPTAFLLAHDCVPNTSHSDSERSFKLTVRASITIKPNSAITLSYAHTLQSTPKRREHLHESKFFWCACKRCSDATELGTFSSALRCPKCRKGLVLPTAPLNPTTGYTCTCAAGYTLTHREMAALTDRIARESEAIDCSDVAGLEHFLEKYRNVLHPTHYLALGVKLSLSQVYGRIEGFLIHELNEGQLVRKLEICEEILGVFDVIEPGYTRLRGVTLYEMHAPLMVLLTRQFESHCSRNEVRVRLRRIVRCLEEASVILGFEPETSAEGIMGVAAKDALGKIRNWEKIIGRL